MKHNLIFINLMMEIMQHEFNRKMSCKENKYEAISGSLFIDY